MRLGRNEDAQRGGGVEGATCQLLRPLNEILNSSNIHRCSSLLHTVGRKHPEEPPENPPPPDGFFKQPKVCSCISVDTISLSLSLSLSLSVFLKHRHVITILLPEKTNFHINALINMECFPISDFAWGYLDVCCTEVSRKKSESGGGRGGGASQRTNPTSWQCFHGHLVALVSQHASGSDSQPWLVWLEPQNLLNEAAFILTLCVLTTQV